jgi:hypothetical protein
VVVVTVTGHYRTTSSKLSKSIFKQTTGNSLLQSDQLCMNRASFTGSLSVGKFKKIFGLAF